MDKYLHGRIDHLIQCAVDIVVQAGDALTDARKLIATHQAIADHKLAELDARASEPYKPTPATYLPARPARPVEAIEREVAGQVCTVATTSRKPL